jgi:tRNA A-37 threonylcarbamoyl transferase component Bud32
MYPQVFGKYVLERELARGGMARVILATLRGAGGFEKRLVVKQIRDELACDDEFVRRFVEEAKTTVALAHPNIVPVYELGVELGTYFLAMEFVEGVSLADLLRASPEGLTPYEGAYAGIEVCRALDYAHRRMGVVHRDVTPRNVMVDEEGQIKVIDFGIAQPVATAASGHGVFGSPGHMPPEQMAGGELTAAADVFAVAVLLMEIWSGRPPFRRRTVDAIEAAMRGAHPRPSDANVRLLPLDDAMASAMALDPRSRPQQADDLGRVLRRFLAGVDLGDVARSLGDRVRAARAHPPVHAEPKPVLQRPPSRPTATQVGTKTFAARDEVRELPAAPTSPPDGSTRRLLSISPAPVRDVETVAMRPIEAEPRSEWSDVLRQRAWLGLSIGASALAILAFLLGRGVGTARLVPSRAPSRGGETAIVPGAAVPARSAGPQGLAVPATTAPSGPARPSTVDAGSPAAAADEAASGAAAPTAAPTVAAPTAAAPAPPAAARAQVALLGDGTLVRVDGAPRGACPIRVALDAGPHSIVFFFPATGESKGERLMVRPGERTTLRADFTGATPAIRVERTLDHPIIP